MSDHILTSTADGVMEITIDRPDKKNALTVAMYAAFADALGHAATDPAIRAVLITGSGGAFTAGNDLKDFLNSPEASIAPDDMDRPVLRFLRAISTAPKPVVAAVQGVAVGVGTTMLLHCDMVVAGRGARFQLPFTNLGLVPEAASSLLLPRLIGMQRAAEMLLLGEPVDAATAFQWGLVNRLVDDAEVLETARGLARKLAAQAPEAVRLTKALMRGDSRDTIAARMAEEGTAFAAQLKSAELKEAVAAFFEKRKPDFSRVG
jgi:enoyl-CoA hydratase/carnithine racemase